MTSRVHSVETSAVRRAVKRWRLLALPAAWLFGVGVVAVGGVFPNEYLSGARSSPEALAYPLAGVAQFIAVLTVETAVLWALLRPGSFRASWGRVVLSLLAFVPTTLAFGMGLMHAPPYQSMHFLWSVAVSLALLVLLAASLRPFVGSRHGA